MPNEAHAQQGNGNKPVTSDTHLRATWVCAGFESEGLTVSVFNASNTGDNYITSASKFYSSGGEAIDIDEDRTGADDALPGFDTSTFSEDGAASAIIVVTTDAFYVSAYSYGEGTDVPCTRVSVVKA
jgi:hypothetical protein